MLKWMGWWVAVAFVAILVLDLALFAAAIWIAAQIVLLVFR